MPDGTDVSDITQAGLEGEVARLRELADHLERFTAGDNEAWTDRHALAGHQLLVRAQGQAAVMRSLRAAADRRGQVVRLHQPR